jgi:hypothetical protein
MKLIFKPKESPFLVAVQVVVVEVLAVVLLTRGL